MKQFSVVMPSALLITGTVAASFADEAAEDVAIRTLLKATFDKPDMRLTVDPVVAEGKHAIADWTQGEMGGRGLPRKNGNDWILILCSGDGLRSSPLLKEAGISEAAATRLVAKLAAAELNLKHERLVQLFRFDGVMRMGGGGHAGNSAR